MTPDVSGALGTVLIRAQGSASLSGSGVSSVGTVTRYYLPTLSANVCSGAPVNDGVQTSGTPTTVTSGRCYYWTFTTPPSDILGNVTASNLTSKTIKVDTVHPTGTLTFDDVSGVTHSRFINASVTMADANSGPLQVRFSTDGGFSWTAWTAYVVGTPTVTPLTLASGTGTYTVLAQIQDLAGNMTPLGPLDRPAQRGNRAVARRGGQDLRLREQYAARHEHDWHHLLAGRPDALPGADRAPGDPRLGRDEQPDPCRDDRRSLRHARQLHSPRPRPDLGAGRRGLAALCRGYSNGGRYPASIHLWPETSSLSTSAPYLTIPYDTVVTVVWGNNVRSEQVTVTLNLRVVVKNSGTTGTH